MMTILAPTSGTSGRLQTMYLCCLDSYTVTVCNGYLVSSHAVTMHLPTGCLVDRLLHRPHGLCSVVTVSGTREQ